MSGWANQSTDPVPGALVGGRWVHGDGTLSVIDPASEAVVATVASVGTDVAHSAADAAAEAFATWKHTSPRTRSDLLLRAYALMLENLEELAVLIVRENGKVLDEARREVQYAAEFFRWSAEGIGRQVGEYRRSPDGQRRIVVTHEPIGVSVLVTPWNFPAAMLTRKLAPALAAGCTVVAKPAPETPLTALRLAELMLDAGVPSGVVNVVVAEPPHDAVRTMLRHEATRKLSFTGSTAVGSALLTEAADQVLSTSMELGGNAPFVVLDDAEMGNAVQQAVLAKMRNAGASCVAANRFVVHERLADEFTERLAASMGAMRLGPGLEPGAQIGPLINGRERDKVAAIVDDARHDGAALVLGGRAPLRTGYFYEPTVLRCRTGEDAILSREVFGPVAPIVTFAEVAELPALCNTESTGLAAYVMGGDERRCMDVADSIEVGMVGINRGIISDPAAPFGGRRRSGLGREGGLHGLEEFLEAKYIALPAELT